MNSNLLLLFVVFCVYLRVNVDHISSIMHNLSNNGQSYLPLNDVLYHLLNALSWWSWKLPSAFKLRCDLTDNFRMQPLFAHRQIKHVF